MPSTDAPDVVQTMALRLCSLAVIVTFGLAFYAQSLDLLRTDIPLRSANGRLFWLLSIPAITVSGLLFDWQSRRLTVRQHASHAGGLAASGAILPTLAMFAALQLVAWDSRPVVMVAAPLLAGVGVFTSVVVRYYLHSGDPAVQPGARFVHLALTGGLAFLSLALARNWMGGPGYTFVICALLSGLLFYQVSDGIRTFQVRRVAYAMAGAFVVGQVAWALSYWPLAGWFAGAFLAVVFSVLMLSVDSILTRNVATDVFVRYLGAGVGVCGVLVLLAR